MAAPFLFHWYDSGAVPVAVTENVAVWPTDTDWPTGCPIIEGAESLGGFEVVEVVVLWVEGAADLASHAYAPRLSQQCCYAQAKRQQGEGKTATGLNFCCKASKGPAASRSIILCGFHNGVSLEDRAMSDYWSGERKRDRSKKRLAVPRYRYPTR